MIERRGQTSAPCRGCAQKTIGYAKKHRTRLGKFRYKAAMTQSSSKFDLSVAAAKSALSGYAKQIETNPQANSVFAYANELFQNLERGTLSIDALDATVQEVFMTLVDERAERFRDQHGIGSDDAWGAPRASLEALAQSGWAQYRQTVETAKGGIVFTGHPTFALSQTARAAFAEHVLMPTKDTHGALNAALAEDNQIWANSITLSHEHSEAQAAIGNAQSALRAYAELVVDVARAAFADQWRALKPELPTIASWIGYDLDGRTDIHWSQSFAFRLTEKAAQLGSYAARLSDISGKADGELGASLQALSARMQAAHALSAEEAALFAKDLTMPENLVTAANAITSPNAARIVSASDILMALDGFIDDSETPDEIARDLAVLRAEINALQLGTARIHLRLNAAQIGTVISRDLGLETENRDPGRGALRQLADLAQGSDTLPVNFADLFLQQSTARRQFMMCAQLLKHVDADSSIRFLIAESENPATVMGALYLAKQYGVAEKLDISPLFETPEALETGGRFIEQLLTEPVYLDYLKARGYLAIQLGFSDAGRFIGQVAADMAIERIHNLISRAVCRAEAGLSLLIFNTHGESMGRGAWPGSFKQRFDHLLTQWTRMVSAKRNVPLMHEVSFQGGDGFLHFANAPLAASTMAAFAEHLLSAPDGDTDRDPFYTRTDLVWDFYRALRAWHERLFDNADYGRLLSDFATGFLVKAGSRQRRRSSGPQGPRSLRAISHNASLQQIGVPLNTAAGIGSALRREQDQVIELIGESPRLRGLVRLASAARMKTSVPALRAYSKVFDPGYWVALSRAEDTDHALAYRRIYYLLQDRQTTGSIEKVANTLSIDLSKFDPMLASMETVPSSAERHEGRLDIHILHAVRQALMMKALSLAGRLPTVSRRHEESVVDIMNLIKAMQLREAVNILCSIFPASLGDETSLSQISETGHMASEDANGYDELHDEIIRPLDQIDRQLRQITLAVSQAYGAYG
jgi:phosphoenolpyruvate carboxylase